MNTSDNLGTNTTDNASDTMDGVKDEISQVSDAGADAAKEVAESRFAQGREATTNQLDSASDAMHDVAEKLEENDSPFASYASELSEQLSSFSTKLSTSSIDDLVGGARSLARDNPAAFMLGSMAIGLAASRFFKATGEQVARQSNTTAAPSGTHHYDRGIEKSHEYDSAETHDAGTEYVAPGARASATGAAGTTSSSAGDTADERVMPSSLNPQDNITAHGQRKTPEEV